MAAKFYRRTVTLSNKKKLNTYFYIADPMDFCVEPMKSSDTKVWAEKDGAYGTNSSFFMVQKNGKAFMSALHIYKNKNMAAYTGNAEGGNDNCATIGDKNTAMDIIYCNGTTKKAGLLSKKPAWTTKNNLGVSNMEWGIGGFNLFPTTTFKDASAFSTGFKKYYPNISYNLANSTSRTAIGIRGNGSVILVAAFNTSNTDSNGPNVFEMHLLMKYFGCKSAILLDGSTCTKVSYKKTDGTPGYLTNTRPIYGRIRLVANAAKNCDWTGV